MALTPVLLVQNAHAASHYCADETKKSSAKIQGCKDGWYDHNHCYSYKGVSEQYDQVTQSIGIRENVNKNYLSFNLDRECCNGFG